MWRYTINRGIAPIKNTQIDRAEMVRCTLSISRSTDLVYCVFCFVLFFSVGSMYFLNACLELFESLWTYAKLPRLFSLFCLPFSSRSKVYNRCNSHSKSQSIKGKLRNKLSWQNFRTVLRQLLLYILRTKVFANTILEDYSQPMFTKTVGMNWLES